MSLKTIAQVFTFVILAAAATSCGLSLSAPPQDPRSPYGPPVLAGTIKSRDIDEASGMAASLCQTNVLWTLNDSGGGPFLYAMSASGDSLGTWRVPNVRNIDWEDLAEIKDKSGKCVLYIGEIGDNKVQREEHAIYRIPEPQVTADSRSADKAHPIETEPAEIAKFSYPDHNQNAETLLLHPVTGEIYVVTKRISGPAGVYKVTSQFGGEARPATMIAEISVPAVPNGLLTGGSISPDGRHVVISDYVAAYEWTLPANAPFDEIWNQPLVTVDIGRRDTGEAVCYSPDGKSLLSTSEGKKAPIYRADHK
ncbi:MAG TPA: hypothetical protein VL501_03705 [Pyrinomonadaceae bacterium]|nr:hypothetical protein [Pyrinomonadaceae bacterium]